MRHAAPHDDLLRTLAAEVVSTSKAAEILGVSQNRVIRYCQQGRLGRRICGRYLIHQEELRRFRRMPPGHRLDEAQPYQWTDERIALLGKKSDRKVAKQLGLSDHQVRLVRQRLGIATYQNNARSARQS